TFYDDLDKISQLETVDLHTYKKCIKAIFQEIAVVFSPQNLGPGDKIILVSCKAHFTLNSDP
ncbi:hypothetical protein AK812_SmicGene47680, partial [Symbiodinium microadriaticum]